MERSVGEEMAVHITEKWAVQVEDGCEAGRGEEVQYEEGGTRSERVVALVGNCQVSGRLVSALVETTVGSALQVPATMEPFSFKDHDTWFGGFFHTSFETWVQLHLGTEFRQIKIMLDGNSVFRGGGLVFFN